MDPGDEPSAEPFSTRDVFADAWRSYRQTFSAHAGWNVAFIALAILVGCLSSCVMVPAAAMAGLGSIARVIAPLVLMVLYGALLFGLFVLFALHQGVTLAISRAEQRGEPVVLGTCVGDASARLPTMTLVVFARFAADMTVNLAVLGAIGAALVTIGGLGEPGAALRSPALVFGVVLGGYTVALAWMIAVRAFLGLAGPCAQYEEIGALAALRRSVRLLAHRRLQLVGLRVVWLIVGGAVYLIAYVPAIVVMMLASQLAPSWSLLGFPMIMLSYFVALHLLSFDSVLDAALYARVTRAESIDELAQVFR